MTMARAYELLLALFDKRCREYFFSTPADGVSRLRAVRCRILGHPCGTEYYNPRGYEPDMHCRNCGDDLG